MRPPRRCTEEYCASHEKNHKCNPCPTAKLYLQDLRRRHVVPFARRVTNAAHVRPPDPTCRTCAEDMSFHLREEPQRQPMSVRQTSLARTAQKTCCSIHEKSNKCSPC